jgi:hypothetical protein
MRHHLCSFLRATSGFVLAAVLLRASAAAQGIADQSATAPVRLGPLAVTPAISLQNVGIDSNVFNEHQNPKQDFTAVLRPQMTGWLHLGRALLSVEGQAEAVYFKKYVGERALNGAGTASLAVPLNRLGVFLGAGFSNTDQRSGFEIDTRARTTTVDVFAGGTVRLGGKTSFVARATRQRLRYDENAENLGTSLSNSLDREARTVTTSLEHLLTPVTTVRLSADVLQDRFLYTPSRDSRSFRVAPGVEFKPNRTVSGGVVMGYRRLAPSDAAVRPFSGLVGAVDLTYTLRGLTRFAVQSLRDVQYSFDPSQEYYVIGGVVGSISRALGQTWGITVRGGRHDLNYHKRSSAVSSQPGGVDTVNIYGGTVFWRLTPVVQTGINADYQNRRAPEFREREYRGLKVGAFVSYGLRGQ